MDILSPEALQSLGLDPHWLDASPLDLANIDDTVYQASLSFLDVDPEVSDVQGFDKMGSDLAAVPESVPLLGPCQGLLDVQAQYLAISCDIEHEDGNSNAPLEGQDKALSSRKKLAPNIQVFPTADGQRKSHQRKKFSDAKRQDVAQVRKDGACIRCHLNKIPVRGVFVYSCFCSIKLMCLVLHRPAMPDMCLTMVITPQSIEEVTMDGLRITFVERCQYFFAWFGILLGIAGFS